MLKRLPSDQLEEESKLALHQIINAENHQNVTYQRDNFGIDGEVRLVHGVEITGKGFKYQLKAGSSYLSSENEEVIRVKVEKKYIHLWAKMNEPVVLIYYHPSTKNFYWKAIQPFLKTYPELLKKDTERIIIPFSKGFDSFDRSSFAPLRLVANSEFSYQKLIYSQDSKEWVITNRFPVAQIPSYTYFARTDFEYRNQITPQLKNYYAFRIERGDQGKNILSTFSDLHNANVELMRFCDRATIEKISTNDIPRVQFVALLNRLIFVNALQMDLISDHDRFYFRVDVLKEGRNTFEYLGVKGGAEKRTKIYQRKNDLLHHAAKIRLIEESGEWFLEVDPDWHITIADRSDLGAKEIGRRITKQKASTRNGDYRYLLHFWSCYLSRNSQLIEFYSDRVGSEQKLVANSHPVSLVSNYTLFNDYNGPK